MTGLAPCSASFVAYVVVLVGLACVLQFPLARAGVAEEAAPSKPTYLVLGEFTVNMPGDDSPLGYIVVGVTVEAMPAAVGELRDITPRLKEAVMRRLMVLAERGGAATGAHGSGGVEDGIDRQHRPAASGQRPRRADHPADLWLKTGADGDTLGITPPEPLDRVMKLLANLRLRTKLLLLLGLSLLSLVVSTGIVTSVMYHRMLDDRVDKLRAVVDSTRQLALGLEDQVAAHQLTREQALERLRADIHAIRFDNDTGYLDADRR